MCVYFIQDAIFKSQADFPQGNFLGVELWDFSSIFLQCSSFHSYLRREFLLHFRGLFSFTRGANMVE